MYYYLGSSVRSFTDDKTGERIEGVSCFFAKDGKNITGVQPIKSQFLSHARFDEMGIATLKPMSKCEVLFNEYGKVAMVKPC